MPKDRDLTLLASGYGLLEAGRWHPEHGLLFSDMLLGGVHHLHDGDVAPHVLIPHRKAIGGLVAHADGGLVISGRNVARKEIGGETVSLLETAEDEQFFNDITADGQGRVFAGAVAKGAGGGNDVPGRLYQVELDGTSTVIADDVLISNGLAADPTDTRLYHVDSGRKLIWRFALRADGPACDREAFVDTSEDGGVPDGIAVAADGSVWVAMAGGGVVVGWDADGKRIDEIKVPASLVTSVCFGGPTLSSLFVLTGANHEHPNPLGGMVYRTQAPRPGLPGPLARIRDVQPD